MSFKVAEGEDFELATFETFLKSLDEVSLFKLFKSVRGSASQELLPSIANEISQFMQPHKFVFEAELDNSHLQDEISIVEKHGHELKESELKKRHRQTNIVNQYFSAASDVVNR